MGRIFVAAGGVAGALAVGTAAVAAHALPPGMDAAGRAAVASAVQMQGWHALAVLGVGIWLMQGLPPVAVWLGRAAGLGFLLGTLLFCGGIYAHHLAGLPTGRVAPFGGITLIVSWLLLGISGLLARPGR
jgi:uncharacterized membrane protein YgdD (TMEM256/DUF423 family)